MNTARDKALTKHLSTHTAELTAKLRNDAMLAGWPKEYAVALKVTVKGLEILANYPKKYAREIEDLEYGTQINRPNSVIRTFMDKHSGDLEEILLDWSLDRLLEEEALP